MTPSKPGTPNHVPIDRFSWLHLLTGAMSASIGMGASTALGAHLVWEVAEGQFKDKVPALFPSATFDTPGNKVADTVVFMLGWYIYKAGTK